MPSFPNLRPADVSAVAQYVLNGESKELAGSEAVTGIPRYRFTGYHKFLDPAGYPAVAPPWGTLNAINLNSGDYAWKVPLGEYPELAEKGLKNTGSENYGGPVVTAGPGLHWGDQFRPSFGRSTSSPGSYCGRRPYRSRRMLRRRPTRLMAGSLW
jgi:hypothetical protein